jgi:HSP20 family molecular chaperone IbpA
MKFHDISVATVLIVANVVSSSRAYMNSIGPNNFRSPSSARSNDDTFSFSPRINRYRQRQERIDQTFRDLQNEINEIQRRRSRNKPTSGQFDFKIMDPFSVDFREADKEAVKKWVDKAFDLASEFNQDFSRSPQEREKTDEILQKSREWVENMYQTKQTDDEVDASDDTATAATADNATRSSSDEALGAEKDGADAYSKTSLAGKEAEITTPYSENQSDETTFMVAVDLPGVERGDVDLTLEKDNLVVLAQRRPRYKQSSDATRTYLKKFAVVEDEIDVNKIEASLINGVLTVSAPKKKQDERDVKIKIPLA